MQQRTARSILALIVIAFGVIAPWLTPRGVVVAQSGYHIGSGGETDIGPNNWPIAYTAYWANPGQEVLQGVLYVVSSISGGDGSDWRATGGDALEGHTLIFSTGMSVDVGGNGTFCFERVAGVCAAIGYSATALTGSSWSAAGGSCSPAWGCEDWGAGINRTSGSGGHLQVLPIYPGDATPTPIQSGGSGNLLENGDFNIAPRLPDSAWVDANRVIQAPVSDGPVIERLPNGSCGERYWVMSRGVNGGEGSITQDFEWPGGGRMYVNWEAISDSFFTQARISVTNLETGQVDYSQFFSNPSLEWVSFRWATSGPRDAGPYRFSLDYQSFSSQPIVAIDNVGLRGGYYNNDCDPDAYFGTGQGQALTTATPVATLTPNIPGDGQNLISNCGFENGWSGWAHNSGSRLFYTGGATGPTYAYLYTVYDNGSDPDAIDVPGNIWTPFNWPGGTMYVSYFTGPGTQVRTVIRNYITGYSQVLQPGTYSQTYNGWLKHQFAIPAPVAGQYVLEASSPAGRIAALDGFGVATGTYATGSCGSAGSTANNDATATAHATNTQLAGTAGPGITLTANQQATDDAEQHATWVAGYNATQTQVAALTQTQAPLATGTWAAIRTQTQAARLTATAQGTPVPTFTITPQPTTSVCELQPSLPQCQPWPPTVVVVGEATLTAIANEYNQTATAQAIAAETQFAQILETVAARAQQTQSAAASQTAGPAATSAAATQFAGTATARAFQTELAAANQTAAAANATATALAVGLTQAAHSTVQAAATGTAIAVQTEIAGANAQTQEAATVTAQAYATQVAGTTATAAAQATAAQATQHAQATANQVATSVVLATQQAAQATETANAAAVQTSLAASGDATQAAEATQTAEAYAATVAPQTATAAAQLTQDAVGTAQAGGPTTTPGAPGGGDPVTERPEPGPGVDCLRPSNPLAITDWIDYEVCRVLTWFSWGPDNTSQLTGLLDTTCTHEPFGTLCEFMEMVSFTRGAWQGIDFGATGMSCTLEEANPFLAVQDAYGLLLGHFAFEAPPDWDEPCGILVSFIVGSDIERGVCYAINLLCAKGLLQWAQWILNAALIGVFLVYIQLAWVAKATSS